VPGVHHNLEELPYRAALTLREATRRLLDEAGEAFDVEIVPAVLALWHRRRSPTEPSG
jgi:HD-GYP domain-containing protein (c-di-GMP phosphodiesterase class II)